MSSATSRQAAHGRTGTRPWSRLPLAQLGRAASSPRGQLILVLLALAVVAAPWPHPCLALPNVLAAVGLAVVLDTGLLWLMEGRWTFPTDATIAALTIALVLSPTTTPYVVACTVALALIAKYTLRTGRGHVLNLAAIALLANTLLFGSEHDWWGALTALPVVGVALLLAGAIFIAWRNGRLPLLGSFLLVAAGGSALAVVGGLTTTGVLLGIPTSHAALFCAGFLLTEPLTSPAGHRWQLGGGALIGMAALGMALLCGPTLALPTAIIVGNLWELARRTWQGRQHPPRHTRGALLVRSPRWATRLHRAGRLRSSDRSRLLRGCVHTGDRVTVEKRRIRQTP